jgi:hypothetical protein
MCDIALGYSTKRKKISKRKAQIWQAKTFNEKTENPGNDVRKSAMLGVTCPMFPDFF